VNGGSKIEPRFDFSMIGQLARPETAPERRANAASFSAL